MFVELKVIGGPAETLDREVDAGEAATLRALLVQLVAAEVAGYEQRRDDNRLLHVLTDRQIATGLEGGRVSSGGRAAPAAPTPERAVERAVEAFGDGLYFVVMDGRQLEDLDAPISVGPSSRLRLIRLVALAGG